MSKRVLRRVGIGLAIGIGVLFAAAGVLLWWLLSTESGTRRAVAYLGGALKGGLSVERVEGVLRGPLTLHGVRYHTDSLDARIATLSLDWRPRELLRRRLDITRLSADSVRVATTPSDEKPPAKLPDLHLPVNVIVRSAEVRDLEIASSASGAGEPTRVDSIRLATSAISDTVRIDRFELRGPEISADASGTVEPQGDYPVDLALSWAASAAGRQWSGRGTLKGTLENLRVAHELSSPVAAGIDATLHRPMRDLSFDGALSFRNVETRSLQPDAPAAKMTGRIHVSGRPEAFTARGALDADVAVNALGRVHADVDVARRGETWNLSRVALRFPGSDTRITARGDVRLGEGAPRFDLALDWTAVSWPLRGQPRITSAAGSGRVAGTPEAYSLSVAARVAGGAALPPGDWKVSGSGTRAGMSLASLRGELMGGAITGSGRFDWSPRAAWSVRVAGDGLNPGAVSPDYPGRLSFEARSEGHLEKNGPHGDVELTRLSGTLRGRPVEASASIALGGETHRLREASLKSGDATATASGTVGDALDLRWRLDAPELQALLAGVSGELHASGSVSGRRDAPRIRAAVRGRGVAWAGRRAQSLRLDADLGLGADGPLQADLTASRVIPVEGRRAIDTLTAALRGSRGDHTVRLRAENRDGSLALELAGGLSSENVWSGRIRALDLQARRTGRWTLASAAPLSVSAAEVSLRDFCWVSGAARLCASGAWRRGGASSVEATIAAVPLALASPWLPPDLEITGALDGRITAQMASGGAVAANGEITAPGGAIRYASADGGTASVAYRNARLEARTGPGGLALSAELPLTDKGRVEARVTLPHYAEDLPLARQAVSGRIEASLRDIGVLGPFLPAVERVGGTLTADWTVGGTAGDPRLSGATRLAAVRAELPDYGLEIRDGSLSVSGDGSGPLSVAASARAGEGEVRLSGTVPLSPSAAHPASLTITGRRFPVLDTYERRVLATPDLRIGYDGRTVRAEGEVRVPEARFEYLRQLATVPVSPDVVVVGQSKKDEAAGGNSRLTIDARVRVVLGQYVRVKAMGFEGRIDGSLLVLEQTGKPTRATGELAVQEGTYKAFGSELTVERGQIRYAGPLNNPGLDLKASRKADDGTVAGVIVKGSLKSPDVQIYSEPPMAQSEALAYLILGHPLGEATPAEGNLVATAATSLGVKAGNLLGKQIARRFGLETARIETKNGQLEQASLVVGKYLSPKLYIEYGIGIFDQASHLRINYILNKKWTIRAETGEDNGADVLYTIER